MIAGAALALLGGGIAAAPEPAGAATADTVVATERATTKLHAGVKQATPGGTIPLALHHDLEPGWHTYWRNPGDSGQAARLTWSLPEGVEPGPVRWPAPHKIPTPPYMTYGYEGATTLLADVAVPADWPVGKPFEITLDAEWLVCTEECIPENGTFTLRVPVGKARKRDPALTGLFDEARAALPEGAPWPVAFQSGERSSEEGTTKPRLVANLPVSTARAITDAYFFAADWGVVEHAGEQVLSVQDGRLSLSLPEGDRGVPDDGAAGVLRVTHESGKTHAYRIRPSGTADQVAAATPANGTAAGAASTSGGSANLALPVLLGMAMLGGVILNLMPCVFPVLAIKAMAIAGQREEGRRDRLASGLAYTVGVLVFFAALGAALIVLRAGGQAVGWGFQLQNPVIVAGLSYLLFAVGLNFSGILAVRGPENLGDSLTRRAGLAGSFFTGALAAIVATPCAAPFMATALGVALTQPAPVAMGAFLSLGLGLALPYLLLTVIPGVTRAMPRPGPWMERLRQALAFPMYAAAAWLVWVLGQQTSPDAVFLVLIGMVLIALAAWIARLDARPVLRRGTAGIVGVVAVAALGGLSMVGDGSATVGAGATVARSTGDYTGATGARNGRAELAEAFTPARLEKLRKADKPVFVNMTADWCITCKVNERVALSGARFRDALRRNDVTYLKGDWTKRDETITAYLERFGRAGVPLYVVYPANGGAPKTLPQILTPAKVEAALDTAGS